MAVLLRLGNPALLTAQDYARERLFGPLGITRVRWNIGRDGRNIGGWGLNLTPRDMAKLGLLYLHGGAWDGRQIVPAEWVRASLTPRVDVAPGKQYGYQWWLYDTHGAYTALGHGGQTIFVIPDLDVIVVTTADIPDHDPICPESRARYERLLGAIRGASRDPTAP